MVRHFESRKKAIEFRDSNNSTSLKVFKKLKGHKNRVKKPFVVCSEMEWLNLN